MHKYMDNTQDWMDEVTEILDQYKSNERRLQGLPPEDKLKDSEDELKVAEDKPGDSEGDAKTGESQPEVSKASADEAKVEPEVKELDESEKEKIRAEQKKLVQAFVVSIVNSLDHMLG